MNIQRERYSIQYSNFFVSYLFLQSKSSHLSLLNIRFVQVRSKDQVLLIFKNTKIRESSRYYISLSLLIASHIYWKQKINAL